MDESIQMLHSYVPIDTTIIHETLDELGVGRFTRMFAAGRSEACLPLAAGGRVSPCVGGEASCVPLHPLKLVTIGVWSAGYPI